MKLHVLDTRQTLPVPIEQAWEFVADPRNLAIITPPSLRVEFLDDLAPRMYAGMLIRYRLRPLLGVPVSWVTEITQVDAPWRFVDEQRFGPYRFFHHQHLFAPVDGGVEMRDLVHYALPRGAGGAHGVLVAPRLREIFAYRREVLETRFGAWPR